MSRTISTIQPEASEIQKAKLVWMRHMQVALPNNKDFRAWKYKLDLFKDEDGLWKCGGRISNSCLTRCAQNPILLDKDHHLNNLLVLEAHRRVFHNGI